MTLLRSASFTTVLTTLLALPCLASAQSATSPPGTSQKPAARSSAKAAASPKTAAGAGAKSTKSAKAAKAVKPPPPPAPEPDLPEAPAEQVSAAELVYYGIYDCEFNQTVNIVANQNHFGYVDVKHGKADYLMKPVLSSTGAIRLEDVRGETLMVQIASKSMLLNVKTAQRVVDDCISPKQRELIEAARVAKAAAAASSAPNANESAPLLK